MLGSWTASGLRAPADLAGGLSCLPAPTTATLTGMTTSPDEERRRAQRWDDPDGAVAEARARAERSADWSAAVTAVSGTGEAERGGVRVEVDAEGVLRRLTVSDVVAAKGGRVVELGVLAAVRTAQEDVTAQVHELTARAWGEDSATTRVVSQEFTANQTAPRDEPDSTHARNDGGQW
ncbi:hypothetical protein KLO01_02430 [Knoellia locipacati]|uniref:YbaB/EbfC DNA-binding family protein n=2 Tax=Knoellia locipacati TaxID=882824 RepID=A0A512SW70_9MICO|nr:hypothetical protein KLO01_02430 [Knoellia locipacati]